MTFTTALQVFCNILLLLIDETFNIFKYVN